MIVGSTLDDFHAVVEAYATAIGEYAETVLRDLAYFDVVEPEFSVNGTTLQEASEILFAKFYDHTGLSLYIGSHDSSEEGSCYDEVDGIFWGLDGVLVESESAKALKNLLGSDAYNTVQYVTFG